MLSHDNLATQFWSNALHLRDQPALWHAEPQGQRYLTWGELARWVAGWCDWLAGLDVHDGDVVATQWNNSANWIALDVACQTLGIVHQALDVRESPATVARLVAAAAARRLDPTDIPEWLLSPTASIQPVDARQYLGRTRQVDPGRVAQLLATSGSTGCPKLVALSHRNLTSNAAAKLDAAPQSAGDLRVNILPFSHAYARTCELSTWILSGSRLALATEWDQLLELAARLQPTLLNVVPYLAESLAAVEPSQLSQVGAKLRLLQVGGAPLHDDLWEHLRALGWPPLQGYGLTEASPVVCSNRAGQQRPGTVGPAVAGTQLKIDSQGVLWLQGPQVMQGYWRDPDSTREVIQDGWLCTGDLVVQTEFGLRVVGRQSNLLVLSTGYKVSPELLEGRLKGLPDVAQAVVTGQGRAHITAWLWPQHARPADDCSAPATVQTSETGSNLWLASVAERIAFACRDLPTYSIPRDLRLLPQRLAVESGTLTRKGTPNRAAIDDWLASNAKSARGSFSVDPQRSRRIESVDSPEV